MARTKLEILKDEIRHYLGIPYYINIPKPKTYLPNALVGKGTWKQITLLTKSLAAQQNIDLNALNPQELYNFRKKNKIGIDCSSLAYNLASFWLSITLKKTLADFLIGTNSKSDIRHLSANLLTSYPNAIPIPNINLIQTADLIRTKQGQHVIFIITKQSDSLECVESLRQGRGVILTNIPLTQIKSTDGIFRLKAFT